MQLAALTAQPCQPAHFSRDCKGETGLQEKYEKASESISNPKGFFKGAQKWLQDKDIL